MISNSPEQTKEIGFTLGKSLNPKDIIVLYGELGSGKTTFISGLAEGLEISDYITSPSFIVINEYFNSRVPFYHIDLYRLENNLEIKGLGIEQILEKNAVIAVEWAERLGALLPSKRIEVRIEYTDDKRRNIEIKHI